MVNTHFLLIKSVFTFVNQLGNHISLLYFAQFVRWKFKYDKQKYVSIRSLIIHSLIPWKY